MRGSITFEYHALPYASSMLSNAAFEIDNELEGALLVELGVYSRGRNAIAQLHEAVRHSRESHQMGTISIRYSQCPY